MKQIIKEIVAFNEERNWEPYHNLKDLALSLNLEAAELLELFQWKSAQETELTSKQELAEELADVLIYALNMCEKLGFDPHMIIREKMKKNAKKYPVPKSTLKEETEEQFEQVCFF